MGSRHSKAGIPAGVGRPGGGLCGGCDFGVTEELAVVIVMEAIVA